MKKMLKIAMLLLFTFPYCGLAEDYTYTTNADNTINIAKYTGSGGAVIIPDATNGLLVTTIGTNAFAGCSSLTSILIGTNITSIGAQAFNSCASLSGITIPNSVTNLGNNAFKSCFSLTNATIGSGVLGIGAGTFASDINLTKVVIGRSVRSLGLTVFSNCTSLAGVYFEGNAPTINSSAFVGATNATLYRLYRATGWPTVPGAWGGRPTALWDDGSAYFLTVNNGTGGGSYTNRQVVTITASNAPSGNIFDRWTGDTQCVASVTSETTTVVMPLQDITLTATYREVGYYTLTVNSGNGGGSYTNQQQVTITANAPVNGRTFNQWTGSVQYVESVTSSPTTVAAIY